MAFMCCPCGPSTLRVTLNAGSSAMPMKNWHCGFADRDSTPLDAVWLLFQDCWDEVQACCQLLAPPWDPHHCLLYDRESPPWDPHHCLLQERESRKVAALDPCCTRAHFLERPCDFLLSSLHVESLPDTAAAKLVGAAGEDDAIATADDDDACGGDVSLSESSKSAQRGRAAGAKAFTEEGSSASESEVKSAQRSLFACPSFASTAGSCSSSESSKSVLRSASSWSGTIVEAVSSTSSLFCLHESSAAVGVGAKTAEDFEAAMVCSCTLRITGISEKCLTMGDVKCSSHWEA
mmetsp:Transcript_120125/g.383469  ORF Transcript_120125/g.383469 Transcript_120125/m.383469 type:complete len:292 (+) Transcript_120125:938-1813(+)